jgi:hypothetical protein
VLPIDAVDMLELGGTEWFKYLRVEPSGITTTSEPILSAAGLAPIFGDCTFFISDAIWVFFSLYESRPGKGGRGRLRSISFSPGRVVSPSAVPLRLLLWE